MIRFRLGVLRLWNQTGALLIAGLLLSACAASHRSTYRVGGVASADMWSAAVVGEVAVLNHHDGHFHQEHCGHFRRLHQGRWIYFYRGQWEFYDEGAGIWYYYRR